MIIIFGSPRIHVYEYSVTIHFHLNYLLVSSLQRPNKADMAAKRSDRQKFKPEESDEDLSDEDKPLPPRVHPRTRAGARQRQEHKQVKPTAEHRPNDK